VLLCLCGKSHFHHRGTELEPEFFTMPSKKNIPFPFVLDALFSLDPAVKPMFGCHAVYVGEKIMLIMRNQEDHPDANGVWIATSKVYHESLKKELPSLCSVYILSEGKAETNWQMIPVDAEDFESSVIHACELILDGDQRIGRIPKARRKKKE